MNLDIQNLGDFGSDQKLEVTEKLDSSSFYNWTSIGIMNDSSSVIIEDNPNSEKTVNSGYFKNNIEENSSSASKEICKENVFLKKVIRNLWNDNKYKDEYIQFLLGAYDEKEFQEKAKEYAKKFDNEMSKEELSKKVKMLEDFIGQKLDDDDIMTLLNIDLYE